MACVLHFSGDHVSVESLLALCPVRPCAVFRKGEPRSNRPNSRLCQTSGVSLVVSEAEFEDFETQKIEAIQFLHEHKEPLAKMRALPGVEEASIDFGIAMRDVISQSDSFEPEFIEAVCPLRLTITLSQYPVAKKFKRIKQYRRALRKAT